MSFLFSCCCSKQPDAYEDMMPDLEMRRRQQMEAAERRRVEDERRGIKNVDAVRRQQLKAESLARRDVEINDRDVGLKWQVN